MSEQQQAPALNLYQKIAAISNEAGFVKKTGDNRGLGFKFIEHSELMAIFRPVLEKYGVVITLEATNAMFHDTQTAGGKFARHVSLAMAYTVVNADNPEEKIIGLWWSEAQGNDDKSINKALTAGEKNVFMKLFHVSDVDPDADQEPQQHEEKPKTGNRTNAPIAPSTAHAGAPAAKPALATTGPSQAVKAPQTLIAGDCPKCSAPLDLKTKTENGQEIKGLVCIAKGCGYTRRLELAGTR